MNGTEFTVTDRSNDELTQKAYGTYNAKLLDQDVISSNNLEWRWIVQQIINADLQPVCEQCLAGPQQHRPPDRSEGHWRDMAKYRRRSQGNVLLVLPHERGQARGHEDTDERRWNPMDRLLLASGRDCHAHAERRRQPGARDPAGLVRAGPEATLYTGDQKVYIASITPGNVLAVRAFKEVESGVTRLVDVPANLYSVRTTAYGTITATEIVLDKPLSHILDQGWRDDIYVTFASRIGPNIADIIEYIVEQYTNLACDPVSFAHVRQRLAIFPANFPINDKRNVLQVLQEIAFQCRCALWIDNSTVYMKYLPEEPDADDTITESDIDAENGIEVELTSTEELVTKMTVGWHLRYVTPPGR